MSYRVFFFATPLARVRVVPLFTAALAALAAVGLSAQDTPDSLSLSAWRVSGPAPSIGADRILTLPAGAELVRTVAAGQVTIRLVSRPFFSATPTGLPSLEVGPATLTFLRDQHGGALILLGDQTLTLPSAIPLAEDGYSKTPLDFTLSYDPTNAAATLAFDAQTFTVRVAAPTGPLNVVLAAGDSAAWLLDTLEVTAPPAQTQTAGFTSSVATTSTRGLPLDPALKARTMRECRDLFAQGDFEAAEKLLQSLNRQSDESAGWHMESVGHLVRLAINFSARGDPDMAAKIALRALAHLTLSEQKAGMKLKPGEAANIKELAAVIQERLLGDVDAARSGYAAAASLAPKSGQAADRLALLTGQRFNASAIRSATTSNGR